MQFGDISQPVWERLVLTMMKNRLDFISYLFTLAKVTQYLTNYVFILLLYLFLYIYFSTVICLLFHYFVLLFIFFVKLLLLLGSERVFVCGCEIRLYLLDIYVIFFSADRSLFLAFSGSLFLFFSLWVQFNIIFVALCTLLLLFLLLLIDI